MKRCTSAPCLADESTSKRLKSTCQDTGPNAREYLQLALARVLELQRELKEESYVSDDTSDLGESDTEDESLMKEVITKVFKDLPGSSSKTFDKIVQNLSSNDRKYREKMEIIRSKSIQLSGYDTCRRVAVDYMKNVVKSTANIANSSSNSNTNANGNFHLAKYSRVDGKVAEHKRGLLNPSICNNAAGGNDNCDIRMRMLRSLDLHLAVKQRDYTAKLMRFS